MKLFIHSYHQQFVYTFASNYLTVNTSISRLTDTNVCIVKILTDSTVLTRLTETLVGFHFAQFSMETISTRAVESIDYILERCNDTN
jgi:hypothetical protein